MKHVPIIGEIMRFYPSEKYKIGKFQQELKDGSVHTFEMQFMGWASAVTGVAEDEEWYSNELVPVFLDENDGTYGRIITVSAMNDETGDEVSLLELC